MTKKAQAIKIFDQIGSTATRDEVIAKFMTDLNMTKAGAATYYATCKNIKGATSHSPTAALSKEVREKIKAVKSRAKKGRKVEIGQRATLWTVCELGEDNTVIRTHSWMSKAAAIKAAGKGDIVVRGLPDIGIEANQLKQVK